MASKYLDLAGLSVFKNKMVGLIPTKTSDLSNDSNFAVDASYVHTDNNYTNTEKSKLNGIEANAQVNVLETVKVNGTSQAITDKAVDITVPTKTSDLTNDSGFLTSHQDISGKVNKSGDTMTGPLVVTNIKLGTITNTPVGSNTINVGNVSRISGNNSIAIGTNANIAGSNSLSVGESSSTLDSNSFAQGYGSEARRNSGSATGYAVTAGGFAQHVEGMLNIIDSTGSSASSRGTYVNIVGNGTSNSNRSNAYTLDWSGNGWFAGDVYVGSTSGTNKDSGSKKLATEDLIPTNNNQLTNGAGYQTASQVQTAIDEALAGVTGIDFQVVTTLPATGVKGTIYLISNSGSSTNAYDEYIYVNNSWEKIGTTDVDLSDYMKFTDMIAITTSEINALFA